MYANKLIKKGKSIRDIILQVEKTLPKDANFMQCMTLVKWLAQEFDKEMEKVQKRASGGPVSWKEASGTIGIILNHLAGISVAAANAMGSLIDTVNEEVANE